MPFQQSRFNHSTVASFIFFFFFLFLFLFPGVLSASPAAGVGVSSISVASDSSEAAALFSHLDELCGAASTSLWRRTHQKSTFSSNFGKQMHNVYIFNSFFTASPFIVTGSWVKHRCRSRNHTQKKLIIAKLIKLRVEWEWMNKICGLNHFHFPIYRH